MKIYNLGSLNIDYVYNVDHFVTAGETLSSKNMKIFPGGKGLFPLGKPQIKSLNKGAIIGDNGEMLLNVLSEAGVDVSRIQNKNGSCGHTIIQVDKKGQNCILQGCSAQEKSNENRKNQTADFVGVGVSTTRAEFNI